MSKVNYPPKELGNLLNHDASSLTFDLAAIIASLEEVSGSKVIYIELLVDDYRRTILDATVASGKHFIVKISRPHGHDDLTRVRDEMKRQCEMMKWISDSSSVLPLPRVYLCHINNVRPPPVDYQVACLLDEENVWDGGAKETIDDEDHGNPYMITDKCDGILLADDFGALSDEMKRTVVGSYAWMALQLFYVLVPSNQIGSLVSYSLAPSPTRRVIGPLLYWTNTGLPGGPFRELGAYFKWLVQRKRDLLLPSIDDHSTSAEADRCLCLLDDFLQAASTTLMQIPNASFKILKAVPVHEDFVPHNIFISPTEGTITGIVGWEKHAVKPAILAAEYPFWILDVDFDEPPRPDPQFGENGTVSREELRNFYDQIMNDICPEYQTAQKHPLGAILRRIDRWLCNDRTAPDCRWLTACIETLPNIATFQDPS